MLIGKQEWYRDATDYSKMAADCSKTSKSTVPAPSHDSTLGGALESVLHGTDGTERADSAQSPGQIKPQEKSLYQQFDNRCHTIP